MTPKNLHSPVNATYFITIKNNLFQFFSDPINDMTTEEGVDTDPMTLETGYSESEYIHEKG